MTAATAAQITLIVKLRREMLQDSLDKAEALTAVAGQSNEFIAVLRQGLLDVESDVECFEFTKFQASKEIDRLITASRTRKASTPARAKLVHSQTLPGKVTLEDGVYKVAGVVYKVIHAVHGSGNQYAKSWDGDSFIYAPGAIRNIKPEHRMTLAEAIEFGALYGRCCNCGRTLTNETSIAAGIGPICSGRFAA